jgi:recombination protein RecA
VTEIASPIEKLGTMRGGASTLALEAVRSVHSADARGWCAWITESNAPMLYAPAVAQAGVDLDRLLVVRPSLADLARTAVKVASSGAFELVVIDAAAGLDGRLSLRNGRSAGTGTLPKRNPPRPPSVDGAVVVRKLAIAAEEKGTSCIVLTNLYTSRAVPWPVALRLEVERRPEAIAIRVTKDRRGRASSQHVVRIAS